MNKSMKSKVRRGLMSPQPLQQEMARVLHTAEATPPPVDCKYMPQPVSNLDIAFGGAAMKLLPPQSEIPKNLDAWEDLVNEWFFKGLNAQRLKARPGIDRVAAFRHLKCIMGSYEPKHEHKVSGVAYLMAQWFEVAS